MIDRTVSKVKREPRCPQHELDIMRSRTHLCPLLHFACLVVLFISLNCNVYGQSPEAPQSQFSEKLGSEFQAAEQKAKIFDSSSINMQELHAQRIKLLQERVELHGAAIATQGGSHEDLVRALMDLKRAQMSYSCSDKVKRKRLGEIVTLYDQLIQLAELEVKSPAPVSASNDKTQSNRTSVASRLLLLKSERLGVLIEQEAIPVSSAGLKHGVDFSVHLVGSEATETTTTLNNPNSDEQLHLVNPPIISSANIKSAEIRLGDDGQVSLDVTIDDDGCQRMLRATSKPEMRLAIVVNGKIVSSPIAHAPISNHFSVTGKQSREYWEQFITTPPAPEKPKLEDAK